MKNKELLLKPSYKCNLRCIHCSSVGVKDVVLDLDGLKTVLLNHLPLARHTSIDEIEVVRISGGEPTILENLIDYVKFFRHNNIKVILQTNGTTYINPEILSFVNEVWISLYGQNSVHNFITRGDDYSTVMLNISEIRKTNKVVIQSPVFSKSQMISLFSVMDNLNLPLRLFALLNHGRCNIALTIDEQILLAKAMKALYNKTEIACSLNTEECNYENKLVIQPGGIILNCASRKHHKKMCKM